MDTEKIAVIGLGYVGLPVIVALARKYPDIVGFDVSKPRISELKTGLDRTNEVSKDELLESSIQFSMDPSCLEDRTFFVVTVPTPITDEKRPDLSPLEKSCRTIGPVLKKGAVVVFESTVYPGVTEEYCGKILEEESGLAAGVDFFLGYSPERINPGDKERRLETIIKIVAADCDASLARVVAVYESIIQAGLHIAPSIKVAEAAKVIENTQRDLNIALMNEFALIFDLMGIRTSDVLSAAQTKWNFLPFTPGLVGGHCIGVDPYYLTTAAERFGYRPEVILSGRRINDDMGAFVARKAIKLASKNGPHDKPLKVGIFGLTFKENVPDLRNSRVPDILREFQEFGITPVIHDPQANKAEALSEYGVELQEIESLRGLDICILAVSHREYLSGLGPLLEGVNNPGVLIDLKSVVEPTMVPAGVEYWSL